MNEKKINGLASIHIATLLFGVAGLFAKWIILPATIIVLGRVIFASLFLLPVLKIKGESIAIKKGDLLAFVGLGLLLAFHWFTFFYSIQLSTVAIGLLAFSSFPLFTTFFEPIFFKEKLRLKDVLVAIVTFIGILVIVDKFSLNNNHTIGLLVGILSGLSFAVISLINRSLVGEYSGQKVALHQDLWASLFLLPFLWLEEFTLTTNSILLLILLGIVFTAIAHALFINGMKVVKAQTASIIASLEPVYGIILAFFVLNETPAMNHIVGGAIILGAVSYQSISKSK